MPELLQTGALKPLGYVGDNGYSRPLDLTGEPEILGKPSLLGNLIHSLRQLPCLLPRD